MSRIYLYAIMPAGARTPIDADGIWSEERQVRTVPGGPLAAVVSAAPPVDFRAVPREDAVRYLLAHQRVVEGVMRTSAALPVKFGTTLPDETAVIGMLKRGASILEAPLAELAQYIQIELIVSWRIDDVIREAAAEETIRRCKADAAGRPGGASTEDRLAIGKLVKAFLDRRREAYRHSIMSAVRSVAADVAESALMDDRMIANFALLLSRDANGELDQQLAALDQEFGGKLHFRCIGPLPPYSFGTVEVSLPSFEAIDGARRALRLGESAGLADIKSAYHREIRQVHADLAPAAAKDGTAARLSDAYKTLMNYTEALSVPGDNEIAGATDYCFDRGAVEGAILVTVQRQTLPDRRAEAQ
jgi:hypothetical protein